MKDTIKQNKIGWPEMDKLSPEQYRINQILDKLDMALKELECRWGVGRIETLVSQNMAKKWQRQTASLNQAISNNDLAQVDDLVDGTIRGCAALELDAIAQGHAPHDAPLCWTVAMPDGNTLAIVRHHKDAALLQASSKDIVIWTVEELARLVCYKGTLVNISPDMDV
jgi:hypothetical protein